MGHKLIKYIRYKYDGGVEIYDGHLTVEKFVLSDITKAIIHRLNAIHELDVTRSNHQVSDETCFLVRLAYDFDKFEQYFEKTNENLILNFCNKEFVSIYSIWFKARDTWRRNHFSKTAIFERHWNIEFSNQIAAPLITLEEVKEKRFRFFYLEIGRMFYKNNLYYRYNEISFCLPIAQLIQGMVKNGGIENYVKDIDIKKDDTSRINIVVKSLRQAHGQNFREYNYYGYLDLNTFDFIIEKHTEEFLSS